MDAATASPPPKAARFTFRSPSPQEEKLRLWVDRIGAGTSSKLRAAFRTLRQYALVAVQDGEVVLQIRGEGPMAAVPGDAIYVHPGDATRYGTNEPWDSLWVVWDGPESRDLVEMGALPVRSCIIPGAGEAVRAAYSALTPLIGREDLCGAVSRKSIMLRLMKELLLVAEKPASAGKNKRLIETIIMYVREHYNSELRIPALAERCSSSRYTLSSVL